MLSLSRLFVGSSRTGCWAGGSESNNRASDARNHSPPQRVDASRFTLSPFLRSPPKCRLFSTVQNVYFLVPNDSIPLRKVMTITKSISMLAVLIFGASIGGVADGGLTSAVASTPDAIPITGPVASTSNVAGVTDIDGSSVFSTDQVQLTVAPASGPAPSDAQLVTMAPSIGCGLDVQWVHGSTHVTGTINGVTVISCNGPAGSLTLHYSLIRVSPNYTQWGAAPKSNVGQSSLKNNRAVNCNQGPGEFQGWAMGEISPPPGYVLVGPATAKKFGAIKPVSCGMNFAVAGSDSTISETISVTFVRSDLAG